jgi:serine/threonine protein kinase
MNFSIGESIGRRYRILELLGNGVHGTVYKVLDTRLQRLVTLKVLHSALSAEAMQVFLREAVTLVRLKHPNIVQVYDADQSETFAYQVFEYIEGRTLSQIMADAKPLDAAYATEIVRQVGTGLGYAHLRGVIHRDVKPSNILVSNDGRVLLADFGLAIAPGAATLTQNGTVQGTPGYMSPEQVMGQPVDARSDIFSLGVVFYELLTGRTPFSGESTAKLFSNVVNQEPASPRQFDDSIPSSINEIVLKTLAKEPGQRFQTADDFLRALAESNPRLCQQEAVETMPLESVESNPSAEGLAKARTKVESAFGGATPEQAEIGKKFESLAKASGAQLPTDSQELLQRESTAPWPSVREPALSACAPERSLRSRWFATALAVLVVACFVTVLSVWMRTWDFGHSLKLLAVVGAVLVLWLLRRSYPARARSEQWGGMPQASGPLHTQRSDSRATGPGEQALSSSLEQAVRQRDLLSRVLTEKELTPYSPLSSSSADAPTHYPNAIAWLLVLDGQNHGREIRLKDNVTIGRDADNDIVLYDARVSRHQAQISLENGRFYISDWSQARTTFVNRIATEFGSNYELHDRDEIEFGMPGSNLLLFEQAVSPDLTPEAKRRLREFDDIWDQLTISAHHD